MGQDEKVAGKRNISAKGKSERDERNDKMGKKKENRKAKQNQGKDE